MQADRHKLLCQYIEFFSKLRESASWEVRLLSEIVARDAQSVTGRNLLNIEAEFKINPWSRNVQSFKLVDIRNPLPEVDDWRVAVLGNLLQRRREMDACGENSSEVSSLIHSLCSN